MKLCKHDLVLGSCQDCKQPIKSRVDKSAIFTFAQFQAKCYGCGELIREGDMIYYVEEIKTWVDANCYLEF